jgi:hypothetical protein
MRYPFGRLSPLALLLLAAASPIAFAAEAGIPGRQPLYAFCGVGDHLWNHEVEPVDSPATIDAMFEWMSRTYGISRMYWREERIWDECYKVGDVNLEAYDWHSHWKRHLIRDLRIHEAAVASAKKHKMEIFFYYGLFEHGVQPDTGVNGPYLFEDELRIEHPEWCSVDRWGERRCPGPISFGYPEVRKLLVKRYADHVIRNGYDGVNFYTYVENLGLRYLNEFGFEQPVVDEFAKRFPGVNLRKTALTEEQKEHWYACRGVFVTQFLRELRAALAPHGKKISIILDSKEPDCVQPWWGHTIPGTGRIRLDWKTWIGEGVVDEFWVQLGETVDQRKTLDLLLKECRNRPVKLTVRTVDPWASHWRPYVAAGVTPVAVITWTNNGIERYSHESTCVGSLKSPDWKLRAQTLKDVATGKLRLDATLVTPLARDPHVLVRRQSAYSLATLGNREFAPIVEALLLDAESSVRIAAADALKRLHGSKTPRRILDALEKDSGFQFKLLCFQTLGAMKETSLPELVEGLSHRNPGVREVCVRALYTLGKSGLLDHVHASIRAVMLNPAEECQNRCWAIDSLVGLRIEMNDRQRTQLLADLNGLVQNGNQSSSIRIHAAIGLGYLGPLLTAEQQAKAVEHLRRSFLEYGDGCVRDDAAYGWRSVGNALLALGPAGRSSLENMRVQTGDPWLAWIAYEVMYSVQKVAPSFNLVQESEAIRNHERYAPRFPGWRKW